MYGKALSYFLILVIYHLWIFLSIMYTFKTQPGLTG